MSSQLENPRKNRNALVIGISSALTRNGLSALSFSYHVIVDVYRILTREGISRPLPLNAGETMYFARPDNMTLKECSNISLGCASEVGRKSSRSVKTSISS